MTASPVDPRKVRIFQTRLRIGEAAVRLIREREWGDVSVSELSHMSGTPLRSFHRYFPRKEFVFEPVLQEAVRREHALLAVDTDPDLATSIGRAAGTSFSQFPDGLEAAHASYRVLLTTEELRPIWLNAAAMAETGLAEVLEQRWPARSAKAGGRLLAALVIAAESQAIQDWALGSPNSSLGQLVEETIRAGMQAFGSTD